ncbi:MFS general substrate transporter [Macrolepiota fuliginosa MF-IS2]|uniref:MFS general substrate transporter n=1 Tax=Macrolepiota fuliginosa MF-IS2 TaxID=1400762 RepID=A0A9P5XQX2_9AGAR|nr:MFS general substrate transporter [Macrolepiota fuliginosa MF-IS2]
MVGDEHTTQDARSSEREPFLLEHAQKNTNSGRTPLPFGQLSILLFLRFCESATVFSVSPFINELLLSLTGGDATKVPYYASVMDASRSGLALVTIFFWSRTSDYLGRKPILLLGIAALATSMLLLGISNTFWMVVLSRCVFGGFVANTSVIQSAIGEMTDESNRADGFGLLHAPWAVGVSIGPLIGGSLANPHAHFPHFFSGEIWQAFPYLLPCATVAFMSSLGFLVVATRFRETLPRRPISMHNPSDEYIPTDAPLPTRALLTPPVLLTVSCYFLLGLSYLAHNAVQPLFLAMPIPVGGLSLQPSQIGFILGLYGLHNSITQTFLLGPSIRRFGLRTVFRSAISAFIPIFLLFPLMNIYAKDWYFHQNTNSRIIMFTLLVLQLALLSVAEFGFGCIFMYINSSAPTKRSLGSVSGLGQTAVSVARFLGPTIANGMLGVSIERNWMGGYAVYFLLSFLVVGSVIVVGKLPKGVWRAEDR